VVAGRLFGMRGSVSSVVCGVLCVVGVQGCAADPELARYIGNDRVLGNFTESELGAAGRNIGSGALAAGAVGGFLFGWWWLETEGRNCGR
jgi:hypothetical protein